MAKNPIIEKALKSGQTALSEHDSKLLLEKYGVPTAPEKLVQARGRRRRRGLRDRLPGGPQGLRPGDIPQDRAQARRRGRQDRRRGRRGATRRSSRTSATPRAKACWSRRWCPGERELVIGLVRDPQFGPCVMFGLGGIFTEILKDTSFRVAPITEDDALQMMDDIKARAILGPVRGMKPADKAELAKALVGLGKDRAGAWTPSAEIDVNPLIITDDGEPVAVDALVVLAKKS